MISFEDRMALVRAGYNASQIAEFDNAPDPQPDHKPDPQPDFAAIMQSLNNSIAAMVSAMQAQNIKTADMLEPAKESPSDILAKLLNP